MKHITSTIVKLFWVSRPISWPNTSYPFAAALLLSGVINHSVVSIPVLIIGTLYFLGPYNLLMYGVNDVFDYESDIKNPRKGGVEGMKESRALHPTIIKAVLWTNIPFIVALLFAGPFSAKLALLAVVFAAVAYSAKGLRFKEIPVLDSVTSSFHFVGPALYGLLLMGAPASAWPWLTAFFLWGMASHAFGAVQDIIPDRAGKIASIATLFGARPTVLLATILYGAASLIVAAQGGIYLAIALMGVCYVINAGSFLATTDKTSAQTNRGWKRFLWLNYCSGAVITVVILASLL